MRFRNLKWLQILVLRHLPQCHNIDTWIFTRIGVKKSFLTCSLRLSEYKAIVHPIHNQPLHILVLRQLPQCHAIDTWIFVRNWVKKSFLTCSLRPNVQHLGHLDHFGHLVILVILVIFFKKIYFSSFFSLKAKCNYNIDTAMHNFHQC